MEGDVVIFALCVGVLQYFDVIDLRLELNIITMVSINKSFLYGIFFASITWAVSLYLYWQLNKNDFSLITTTSPLSLSNDKKIRNNNIINKHKWSSLNFRNKHSNYVNSKQNIIKLQSVNKHANDSDAGKTINYS